MQNIRETIVYFCLFRSAQPRIVSQERSPRVSLDPRLVTTQQKRSRGKKFRRARARADLRNCSTRNDEIVPVWTRRDSRQALTAMTYDLEYLILLTIPSLEQPMLYLGIRSEAVKVKTTMLRIERRV